MRNLVTTYPRKIQCLTIEGSGPFVVARRPSRSEIEQRLPFDPPIIGGTREVKRDLSVGDRGREFAERLICAATFEIRLDALLVTQVALQCLGEAFDRGMRGELLAGSHARPQQPDA